METQTGIQDGGFAYHDTNVWVSYMITGDIFHESCKPLIEDIIDGRRAAVISLLTILESIHVIRRAVIENKRVPKDSASQPTLQATAKKRVNDFIRLITSLQNSHRLIMADYDKGIREHYSAVLNKLSRHFGDAMLDLHCNACGRKYPVLSKASPCPDCGSPLTPNNNYRYRGLGSADIEHAYFAIYGRASTFYTTDQSFDALRKDPDFNSINFKIIGSKRVG